MDDCVAIFFKATLVPDDITCTSNMFSCSPVLDPNLTFLTFVKQVIVGLDEGLTVVGE